MQMTLDGKALKIHIRKSSAESSNGNGHEKKAIGQRSDAKSLIKLKCQRFAISDSKSRRKIKNKLA